MTKEITKAFILQQIQDKFQLRELIPSKFEFSETVLPIYNIEPHVERHNARFMSKSVTGTGGLRFYTVGEREKWHLNRYSVIFMGAGAHTVSGVYYTRAKELVGDSFIYLDLTAGQTVSYSIDLPKAVILESDDKIWVNIDGYTSIQDLRLYIDYTVEEIR